MTPRRSWRERLQLEAAKRIVTAARNVVSEHSASLALCGIAAGLNAIIIIVIVIVITIISSVKLGLLVPPDLWCLRPFIFNWGYSFRSLSISDPVLFKVDIHYL